MASLLYSLVRFLLDVVATSRADRAKLQAEVLVLRRQVQVLERQIKRVHWSAGDRMIIAALRDRLPQDPAGRDCWCGQRQFSAGTVHWCAESGRLIAVVLGAAGRRSPKTPACSSCAWRARIQGGATFASEARC